jgi:hypothetical protein
MNCKDTDLFYSQKNKLHNDYVDQLNKTMKEYPSFQMGTENKYADELSKLNGITKNLQSLQTVVSDKTTEVDRLIQQGDSDIRKSKKIYRNLSNYTTYEELDITSKRLLNDAKQEYTKEKIVFYIKGIVILFLCYLLYQRIKLRSWIETIGVVGITVLLFLIATIYRFYTSTNSTN